MFVSLYHIETTNIFYNKNCLKFIFIFKHGIILELCYVFINFISRISHILTGNKINLWQNTEVKQSVTYCERGDVWYNRMVKIFEKYIFSFFNYAYCLSIELVYSKYLTKYLGEKIRLLFEAKRSGMD